MTVFEDVDQSNLWQMYWQGYKQGRNVESMTELDRRAAKRQFEQFLSRQD